MAHSLAPAELAGFPAAETEGSARIKAPPTTETCASERVACSHCGEPCGAESFRSGGHSFCCLGCQTVFGLLHENGLADFYTLGERPGARVAARSREDAWAYLDDPTVRARLIEFEDAKTARITFKIPAIHCIACVWLLENLFRLDSRIGRCRVNFARRQAAIAFSPDQMKLSEVALLLDRIGYPPSLTLAELERPAARVNRGLALRIAVAGFAFGNIMLFSLPMYLGLDGSQHSGLRTLFNILSLILILPVMFYSASDFWRSALSSVRQRMLTLEVPIAAGLAAIFLQSAWEILAARGDGYLDSMAGLVFFLLCGRAFQQKTYESLVFDRDYRGFFPLAVVRRTAGGEETTSLANVRVGDRLLVRHGEIVPADSKLISEQAFIDYSFVTGEADPVAKRRGDHLYAGGRQEGGMIEVETVKPVSQSYLTSLWNDEAFRKPRDSSFETLTNRYSRRFTLLVVTIAVVSAVGWILAGQPVRGIQAFSSVLIVACPCALALAAPFTLGSAQRLLARRSIYLRNAQIVEVLADINAVAFDKTGTLTAVASPELQLCGAALIPEESARLGALCRQSTHPLSRRLATLVGETGARPVVTAFREVAGCGVAGTVDGHPIVVGSRDWLKQNGIRTEGIEPPTSASAVWMAMDGRTRGVLMLENRVRAKTGDLIRELSRRCEVVLLSGDNESERKRFASLFGSDDRLHFRLSPHEKLARIRHLQSLGRRVMMVGDGLNDAGALRQGDIGVAVVEGVGRFSPASDVILDASRVGDIGRILEFCRGTGRFVRAGFAISAAYNVVGVSIAAAGLLSPLVCAILMPLSSLSVVVFALAATHWKAARAGWSGEGYGGGPITQT